MSSYGCMLIKLLAIQCLIVVAVSNHFDFYYLVLEWPPSYCDTEQGCCYPTTGKPAEDFSIHGLWPSYYDGYRPTYCCSGNSFNESKILDLKIRLQEHWPTLACPSSDGLEFWAHEWNKHGTCSESVLDQHAYFERALDLRDKANLLKALDTAGISSANGVYHTPEKITNAIKDGTDITPFLECNVDTSGNQQLYQVYTCVDKSGSKFIDCPVPPLNANPCGSKIEFPPFPRTSALESSFKIIDTIAYRF